MTVKARTVSLTSTPSLLESPEREMVIYFRSASSFVKIGGDDITSSSNGIHPDDIEGSSLILSRGDDLYGVSTSTPINLTYLVVGD